MNDPCSLCREIEETALSIMSTPMFRELVQYSAIEVPYTKMYGFGALYAFEIAVRRPDIAQRFVDHGDVYKSREAQLAIEEMIESIDQIQ